MNINVCLFLFLMFNQVSFMMYGMYTVYIVYEVHFHRIHYVFTMRYRYIYHIYKTLKKCVYNNRFMMMLQYLLFNIVMQNNATLHIFESNFTLSRNSNKIAILYMKSNNLESSY